MVLYETLGKGGCGPFQHLRERGVYGPLRSLRERGAGSSPGPYREGYVVLLNPQSGG